jgi:bleomycin hydrolase
MRNLKFTFFLLAVFLTGTIFAQTDTIKAYQITLDKKIPTTSVKNQYRSGTCWSFSGVSFLESEVLRLKKETVDLSEMFIVRNCYSDKATKYVRLHGNLNFGSGGAFHDVTYVLKNYGLVPEEAYPGLHYGTKKHVHGELDAVLKNYVDAIIKNKNKKITSVWHIGFDKILDTYLGDYPSKFTYKGKEYTPKSFAKMLGLNADNYIEVTSYTHHPFYQKFPLELPDNWLWENIYNVPLDDMMRILDNALDNGYTVAWASDVSERGFSWKNGIAILPDEDAENQTGLEKDKWLNMDRKDKISYLYNFEHIVKEKKVTQEMRQEAFDNWKSTDDHGMHIVGYGHDQNGTRYYLVKNSWDVDNPLHGYFYASAEFVKCKTTGLMINKNAVPKDIAKKLGL